MRAGSTRARGAAADELAQLRAALADVAAPAGFEHGHWVFAQQLDGQLTIVLMEGWLDPTRALYISASMLSNDCGDEFPAFVVSHSVTGRRVGTFWTPGEAVYCTVEISHLCDWGDWTQLAKACKRVLRVLGRYNYVCVRGPREEAQP